MSGTVRTTVLAGLLLLPLAGAIEPLLAQAPEFDAAEVRVSKLADAPQEVEIPNPPGPGIPSTMWVYADLRTRFEPLFSPNGAVTLRYLTMRQLITQAYLKEIVRDEYLTGGPAWMESDHFDLLAKAPPGASLETERLMLQKVLAERFRLALHRQQKPLPVYALVVSKKGLKLQPAAGSGDPDCKRTSAGAGHAGFTCTNMTMAELANRLPSSFQAFFRERPLVDRTGLKGAYDFQADWTVQAAGPGGGRVPRPRRKATSRRPSSTPGNSNWGSSWKNKRSRCPSS